MVVSQKDSKITEDNVKIKILIFYHKKTVLLKNDICVPIHCGRDILLKSLSYNTVLRRDLNWMLKNLVGDNTGDNISKLNKKFCEMTGMYWAWKNYDKIGNPDYIGFMHYRTIFNLTPYYGFDSNYMSSCGYTKENLYSLLKTYKYIGTCSFKYDVNSYEKYKELQQWGGDIVFYDTFLEILKEKYPDDYTDFVNWNKQQETGPYKNMFITSKEEFFKYSEWIFPKLLELDKKMADYPYNKKHPGAVRSIAWLSEIVTSFYFWRLGKTCEHKEFYTFRPIVEQHEHKFVNSLHKVYMNIKRRLF